jgi:HlyD family secretion protein
MIRCLLLFVACLLIAAMGLWLDRLSRPAAVISPAQQEPGNVHASGRVEGATPEIAIRSEIPGQIAEVCVREGDIVPAGALLLRLDASAAVQQVARMQAESDLAAAQLIRLKNGVHEQERLEAKATWEAKQAELRRTRNIWERSTQLEGKASISQQEIDSQRGEMEAITFQVAAAKARWEFLNAAPREEELQIARARCAAATADLQLAKIQLAKTELRSRAPGQVLKRDCDPGELIGPEAPEPLLLLADTRKLRIRAFVEELDARRIKVGQPARVSVDDATGGSLPGWIVELAPRMSRKQSWSDQPDERFDLKSREVVIELKTPADLPLGMAVEVEILPPGGERPRMGDMSVNGPDPKAVGLVPVKDGRMK